MVVKRDKGPHCGLRWHGALKCYCIVFACCQNTERNRTKQNRTEFTDKAMWFLFKRTTHPSFRVVDVANAITTTMTCQQPSMRWRILNGCTARAPFGFLLLLLPSLIDGHSQHDTGDFDGKISGLMRLRFFLLLGNLRNTVDSCPVPYVKIAQIEECS